MKELAPPKIHLIQKISLVSTTTMHEFEKAKGENPKSSKKKKLIYNYYHKEGHAIINSPCLL